MLRFAVIGHPVAHSLSPRMHAASFRALDLDATYEAFDVAPEALADAFARFRQDDYRGLNVTVPHKLAVANLVTRLDTTAERAGAVNTVRFEADGTSTGFNTDMYGFRAPLDEAGFVLAGAQVVLFGAGGAARAVAHACLGGGCAALTIVNRTRAKAEALAAELAPQYPGAEVCGVDATRVARRATPTGSDPCAVVFGRAGAPRTPPDGSHNHLLINATSVGLKPEDPCAIPQELLRDGCFVYDLAPVAWETATLRAARAAGCRTLGGHGMLIAQGAESFRIWTGRAADRAAMRAAIS